MDHNNNFMDSGNGPWYETSGPSANNVRNDMFTRIKKGLFPGVIITDNNLKRILQENIPDTKTDFGSWRGYATFGLENSILKKIEKDIRQFMK